MEGFCAAKKRNPVTKRPARSLQFSQRRSNIKQFRAKQSAGCSAVGLEYGAVPCLRKFAAVPYQAQQSLLVINCASSGSMAPGHW
jgi:hypothetical protein